VYVTAAGLIVAATVLASRTFNRQPTSVPVVRIALAPPEGTEFGLAAALSPDGRWLTFIASTAGRAVLWVRALNALEGHPLAGTEDASFPFWSPDSRSIGFFAGGKLKTVEATGTPPVTVCDAYNGRGGTWAADGTIIYAPGFADPLYRVVASGGEPKPLTTLDRGRGESAHLWPWFLPDRRHFVFLVRSERPEYQGIYVGSLDSAERVRLSDADSNAQYARPGYLLFARGQTLMAQEFDTRAFMLTGNPVRIAERLRFTPLGAFRNGLFTASDSGTLVYASGGASSAESRLVWVDRGGNVIRQVGDSPRLYTHLALSPDAHHIAAQVTTAQSFPLTGAKWQVSVAGGMLPKWRGDGRELFFLVPGAWHMMAADVITEENFQSKTPHLLFQLPVLLAHGSEAGGHYGVAPDGQRFLVGLLTDEFAVQSLNVVVNWTSDLIR
jgi:Tol biopolymer transport system component